ncbi:MAG: hypothetical protein KGM99_16565, partial [Burkholderiales bacterium]|nr:hypothetical protein [Burkholderiales bacterium]
IAIASDCLFPCGLALPCEHDLGLLATCRCDEYGEFYLQMQTTKFAQSVFVHAPGFRPDDNYFHLAPGNTKIVRLYAVGKTTVPAVVLQALNARSGIRVPTLN